ncbi:MAG: YicC family protein [Rhodospirillales bacterium]|nr:YicC family protein [Rhodospirillales bacterium]
MTGFARSEGQQDGRAWTWEVKSVNGRGLDVRCRLALGFENLEQVVRDGVAARCKRGNIAVTLTMTRSQGDGGYRINQAVLAELLTTLPQIRKQIPDAATPSIDGLLALRGVIEPVEETLDDATRAALEAAMLADLDRALEALSAMRDDEGARLSAALRSRLDEIGRLTDEAEELAALQPAAIRERLKTQVETLIADVPAIPEERLAQEAAILMSKADMREELDRLKAHGEAARELMEVNGPVGRKLDFLCQEFNREANTLCSKSQDVELTRIGIELKTAIEQLREQVQNIE